MELDDELHKITKRVIAHCGGLSAVARHLRLSTPAVSQWKKIPSDHLEKIEAFCDGQVSAAEMRPDLQPRDPSLTYLVRKIHRIAERLDSLPGVDQADRRRIKKIKAALDT